MWVESLFTISCSQQTGDLYSFVIWQKLARTRREFISDDLSSLWVEFNLKIILLYWSHYVRGFIELWEWEWRKIRRGVWSGVRGSHRVVCASCLFIRSEIDWAKRLSGCWYSDKRSRISKLNFTCILQPQPPLIQSLDLSRKEANIW